MKKFLLSLLALSLLSLTTIANAKSIRIGTEGAYPPWNNLNSAGDLEGAEIDFGNEACTRMGVECEWVTQDWDGIIPALLNGKYDIIIAGMSITEERKQKVNFTDGYMTDPANFAVLKSSNLGSMGTNWSGSQVKKVDLANPSGKELTAIAQINTALDGMVVGVQSSTIHQNYVEQYMQGAVEMRLYQTQDDLNLDLAAGRIDAALAAAVAFEDYNAKAGNVLSLVGPTFSGGTFGSGVGVGIRKDDTKLLSDFNSAIDTARKKGIIKKLAIKHFGFDASM